MVGPKALAKYAPPWSEDSIGGQGNVYGVCGRGLLLLIAK